jgi:hypothetical protein
MVCINEKVKVLECHACPQLIGMIGTVTEALTEAEMAELKAKGEAKAKEIGIPSNHPMYHAVVLKYPVMVQFNIDGNELNVPFRHDELQTVSEG